MKNDIQNNKFLTQKEVAEYFRISQGTVRNWRKRGLLSYLQMPGSTRVLYYRNEVIALEKKHKCNAKGGDKVSSNTPMEKPTMPSKRRWRV